MQTQTILSKTDLIYPELSYRIVGVLFEVFNNLGAGHREKHYQRAVAAELKKSGLKYQEQVVAPIHYKGDKLGAYLLDFLIDDKIILELKKDQGVSRKSIEQVIAYLKAFKLKLAIIANFTINGVRFRRVLNS